MAYIVGQLSEQEENELVRRGWTVESAPAVDFDSNSSGPHPDCMRMVWVDSSMFEVMNGPDWEKGKLPIVIVEGGIVQEVLNVNGYDIWDWNDFQDAPCECWEAAGEDFRDNIRATFSALAIRQIQEELAEEMADAIELEKKRQNADPFWMVPAK